MLCLQLFPLTPKQPKQSINRYQMWLWWAEMADRGTTNQAPPVWIHVCFVFFFLLPSLLGLFVFVLFLSGKKKVCYIVLPSVEDPDKSMTTYTFPSGSRSIWTDKEKQRVTQWEITQLNSECSRGAFLPAKQTHQCTWKRSLSSPAIHSHHYHRLHHYFHYNSQHSHHRSHFTPGINMMMMIYIWIMTFDHTYLTLYLNSVLMIGFHLWVRQARRWQISPQTWHPGTWEGSSGAVCAVLCSIFPLQGKSSSLACRKRWS